MMLLAIGYRVHGGLGGPSRFASGRAPEGEFEAAIDRAAAHRLGVGVGDSLNVNGRIARITGITRDTNLLITQFLFFDFDVAANVSGLEEQASFVVVRARPGRTEAVASAIREAFPGVLVLRREVFERNSLREAASGFLPVLTLVTLLGVISGAVLIALLVQGVVEDRRADIAVLLAMGTGLDRIGIAVVGHAALLVALGTALGLVLSLSLGAALDALLPTVQLAFLPGDIALGWVAFALAGTAGALIPVLRMHRIDPAEAFRS
jgi:putative ABC transport system permease protein